VTDPENPVAWPNELARLEDVRSGVVVERGQLVALVTDTPDHAAVLVDRLGRFVADTDDVLVNGVAISSYALADVRSHVIVSEIEPRLFSGELRYELMPHGLVDDERILDVLRATSSLDVLDALEEGLSTTVEERGRGFSGGQRQRLNLARAILTNADVLILVDPTSAVDTHTEGRIAARLRDVRGGHTTLVATSSPLLLEKMDVVFVVLDGRVPEHGTHDELVERSSTYRQIVLREDS
jgi:ABC-type multidrug transport system fused ATPase/permease subunit